MSQILYFRFSSRHNWELLCTQAENKTNFIRNWNLFLRDAVITDKSKNTAWIERHPKAQIGLAQAEFEGGIINEVDNLRPNSPMIETWNVSDLVTKITITSGN